MDSYIDIRIQPDAEMRANVLLNKVYSKLHKGLHDIRATNIGASFPDYKVLLGTVIRLHGTDKTLSDFQSKNWLGGLSGYCRMGEILPVPQKVKYCNVSRWQHNMSESHLRRLIKRGSITQDKIKAYKAKMFVSQMTTLPYLELESTSTGKHHRRYIQMSELYDEPVNGDFDTFGLSKTATIPWF
ncbi:type I-F CRISPR-associated endoribonuclease Cas6/Csy4 [Paraglaciecola aquimarina]|uniref:Type I-F CRISPR-associated endoribonuclease Cas6/Csy4 n=1 Tax=Paraglaciecola aquimarina TaxID=1235557 RepID=A0ABU3T0K3_9ALTE|nr:type I-F CRISPR-associated endoribonuclease Cas6/Csy4 [Paraglaciecola aquimarina]MDU0355785.1 type I-F CRISPR-associated endoribonuclease Cas6/Csy4 [Paraglaciecola aquimarina]